MREVDDERLHEGLMALALGGPSGFDAGMVSLLEWVDIRVRSATSRRSASPTAEPSGDGQAQPARAAYEPTMSVCLKLGRLPGAVRQRVTRGPLQARPEA